MRIIKVIALLLLSLSIAVAGLPAQAKLGDATAAMTQQMAMQDCHGGGDMSKQQPTHNGCPGDTSPNSKCSVISGCISMNLSGAKAGLPAIGKQASWLYPADTAMASAHPGSQERPPKSLS